MAFEYIALSLINNGIQSRSNERRILRQMEDPFDLSDNEFKKLYRLRKDQIYEVVDRIENCLSHNRISGISPDKQVKCIIVHIYILN